MEPIGPTIRRVFRQIARRRHDEQQRAELERLMDWTGTRLRITDHVGELTLTPQVAGPYSRDEAGVVEFVQRYARAAISRQALISIVVKDPEGNVLGEVLPEAKKVPF